MFKIAIKDLRIFFTDKKSVFLAFVLPILLITLFALAYGAVGKKSSKIKIIVKDSDHTPQSKMLIDTLQKCDWIQLVHSKHSELTNEILRGKATGLMEIKNGYSDSLTNYKTLPLAFTYNNAEHIQAAIFEQNFMQLLSGFLGKKYLVNKILSKRNALNNLNVEQKKIIESIAQDDKNQNDLMNSFGIQKQAALSTEKNSADMVQAIAGTAIVMLLFGIMGIAGSVIEEREQGTLKRMLFSSLTHGEIIMGKLMAANFISLLQMILMFSFAVYVFNLQLTNIAGVILTTIVTIMATSGIGMLIAVLANTRQQAQIFFTIIILIMSAIGGSMIPLYFMPDWMSNISVFTINYWSIDLYFDFLWRNISLSDTEVLMKLLLLLSVGVLLYIFSILLFKSKAQH